VTFGTEGILEIHVFSVTGAYLGKFQPRRGGDDLLVEQGLIYIVDRERGLSIYRLPF
jgi:hypothetical protein